MFAKLCAGVAALAVLSAPAWAQTAPFDAAAAFGAREAVEDVSLSPDGTRIAYVTPAAGQGSVLYTVVLGSSDVPKQALAVSGDPERLGSCDWVSNDRLVCAVYGTIDRGDLEVYVVSRLFAVNADGTNPKQLSTKQTSAANFYRPSLYGGSIVDWLPDEEGAVLMARDYIPETRVGSLIERKLDGLGVDRIDTRTVSTKRIEPPRGEAIEYISDGRGNVRIMGMQVIAGATQMDSGVYNYSFRKRGSQDWLSLGAYDSVNGMGFNPYAVDYERDVVYGLKKKDGRWAAYEIALDGSGRETLIYARPDVDISGFLHVGRRNRVVGVRYSTDRKQVHYIDAGIERLQNALAKALPKQPQLRVVDASFDENKLLVFADGDNDAGAYYLFDRTSKQLGKVLDARPALLGASLATMSAVTYSAADGTQVPAYLTLPPGSNGKGLPAIVLPHGGPGSRDQWGFDWLPQFFAARGFAVLQPQFRGSRGYGDDWFKDNGFKSWKTAIGDVADAGRWLVAQGIARPDRLGIVGWSYGGYAALQSAATYPDLFKAVVAIAPVTDLLSLKEESRNWTNFRIVSDYVGSGLHVQEGSPAQNADRIKAPVLLFHGENDRNVRIAESRLMDAKLASAGVLHEFVAFPKLDHYLEDSAVRTQMLRKSDEFIRKAIGM